MKKENNKEYDFYFNPEKEYNDYISIGEQEATKNKTYKNYCHWKNTIIEKYQNFNINSLMNFKAKINKLSRDNKYRKERILNYQIYISIIVSFAGILLTLFIALQSNYYNLKLAINDTLEQIENQDLSLTEKATPDEISFYENSESATKQVLKIRKKAKNLQELVDSHSQTLNVVFPFSFIILIIIVAALVHYTKQLDINNRKLDFYNDYIQILDEMIEEKQKLSSTEDRTSTTLLK